MHYVRTDAIGGDCNPSLSGPSFLDGAASVRTEGSMAKMTPMERFIAEIPSDRRRAFDLRQSQAGLKRVNVTVPEKHVDNLKLVARFLRNMDDEDVDYVLRTLEEGLRCDYEMMDDELAAGRSPHGASPAPGDARPQRSEDAQPGEREGR